MRAVLRTSPTAAAVVDADGVVRLWNQRATQVTGWPEDVAVGGPDPSVPQEASARAADVLRHLLAHPESAQRSVADRVRPDGSTVSVTLLAMEPLALDNGPGALIWFDEASAGDLELRARNRLASRLVAAQTVDEVLPVLAEALRELLDAEAAVVLAPCPSAVHLHGLHGIGVLGEEAEAVRLDLDDPASASAMASAGQFAVGHLVLRGRRRPTWFVPMGATAAGWVLAVQAASEAAPTLLQREMAAGLADEAWIALQRATLVSDLADKIEILEATNRLASTAGLELGAVLANAAEQAALVLGCERAGIYVFDEEGALRLAHAHATDARPEALVEQDEGLRLAKRAANAADRVLYQEGDQVPDASGPWHEDAGAVSLMGMPLRVGERTVGALVVAHTTAKPRGFTSLCMQVGDAVAHQAALAVEHARLFEAERDRVGRLKELDRLKADWMAGLTHDLRSPLTGLLGFVQTMQRMADDVEPEQRDAFLGAMERQARRLVRLVEDLLLAAQIEGGEIQARRDLIEMAPVVSGWVATLPEAVRANIDVNLAPETAVIGDLRHIERVVQNLVDNALTHGGEPVWIDLSRHDDQVVLRVADDGPGIAVADRSRVFERFVHGDAPGSTGLGLFLSLGIAWAHGGDLKIVDDEHRGACFELTLPAA